GHTGGGIDNIGVLAVTNSTLAGNSAFDGGAITNNLASTLTLTNSTLAGNSVSVDGGAILNSGTLALTNRTLAPNTASALGGAIVNSGGTATIGNMLIAGNTAPAAPDVAGGLVSQGSNLIGDSSGGSGFTAADLIGLNPLLAPLGNNGGPTQTMALLP